MPASDSKARQTVLITGGCGFIGSHLVRLILLERPEWRVINVDALTYAGNMENLADEKSILDPTRYRFVKADVADAPAMDALFGSEPIQAVANLAAETHVDRSLVDGTPFLRTNVVGMGVLLEAATRHRVARFLQVSTDEVYGSLAQDDPSFTEERPLTPNSPYAASKAAADLLARAYHVSHGLPVLVTRCGNNYGPYQFPEKFVPLFITNALDDEILPLYGDGRQIRDWIHVEDHSRALLRVLEEGTPGEVYNISAGHEESNRCMAERILAMLGKPRNLIRHVTDRPAHDRRYALDSQKIQTRLGWSAKVSLEEGLLATVSWYREHRAWWERIKSGVYRSHYSRWYGQRLSQEAH